jgi:hypothetical protein
MEPIVFAASEGEVYDTGVNRLRVLAQAPDHPWSLAEMAEIAVRYDFEPMPRDG